MWMIIHGRMSEAASTAGALVETTPTGGAAEGAVAQGSGLGLFAGGSRGARRAGHGGSVSSLIVGGAYQGHAAIGDRAPSSDVSLLQGPDPPPRAWVYWRGLTSLTQLMTRGAPCMAGARGYVLKDAEKGEIVRAIHAVAGGEAIFSPAIAARVIAFLAAGAPAAPAGTFPALTQREHAILHLLGQGANNAAIAARLGLQTKTVANYVSTIFGKLQVADRAEAMIRAREASRE